MGIGKKVILTLVTSVMGINLIACNTTGDGSKVSAKETNYYSTTIDGKKLYYSEDDENVTKIKEFASVFVGYAVDTDYRDGEYLKEYDCYTKEETESNETYGLRESTEELVISWELVMELNSFEIKEIELHKLRGQDNAVVTLEYISTVTNATDEYIEKSGLEMNAQYKRSMTLYVSNEDNEWKATYYDVGDREKIE